MRRERSLLPHSSLLTPHSSLLTPHSSSLLTPHSSLLTPHSSLLTPHSSLLTPHSSLLTPHSSLVSHRRGAAGTASGTWMRSLFFIDDNARRHHHHEVLHLATIPHVSEQTAGCTGTYSTPAARTRCGPRTAASDRPAEPCRRPGPPPMVFKVITLNEGCWRNCVNTVLRRREAVLEHWAAPVTGTGNNGTVAETRLQSVDLSRFRSHEAPIGGDHGRRREIEPLP